VSAAGADQGGLTAAPEQKRPGGAVVWLTGLPSSGKSTLAARLSAELRAERLPSAVLDGDEVRAALVPAMGYTGAARDAFYATLANLAALLARQGTIAIVAATANRRAWRERARSLCPRFVEVYLEVPLDECRRRDAKGLYARAAQGSAHGVPGADTAYEAPLAPEVVARGGEDADALQRILRRLHATE
jgi:adenylylsulfate kinase